MNFQYPFLLSIHMSIVKYFLPIYKLRIKQTQTTHPSAYLQALRLTTLFHGTQNRNLMRCYLKFPIKLKKKKKAVPAGGGHLYIKKVKKLQAVRL